MACLKLWFLIEIKFSQVLCGENCLSSLKLILGWALHIIPKVMVRPKGSTKAWNLICAASFTPTQLNGLNDYI